MPAEPSEPAERAAPRVAQGLLCCCNLVTAVLLGLLLATVIILREMDDISSTDSIEDDNVNDTSLGVVAITLGVLTAAGVVFAATACVRSAPVAASSVAYSVIVTAGGVAFLVLVGSSMVIVLLPPVICIALGAKKLMDLRRERSAVENTPEDPANTSIRERETDEDSSVASYHGERLLSPA